MNEHKQPGGSAAQPGNVAPSLSRSVPGAGATAGGWNPAARVAVFVALSVLTGVDIWIFTAAKISSLPQLQVQLTTGKAG